MCANIPAKRQTCCPAGCCASIGRRDFLAGLGLLGGSALAAQLGLFDAAVAQAVGTTPRPGNAKQPLIRAAFAREPVDHY